MNEQNFFKDRNVLIIGYALTGKSVAEFLIKKGSKITINDRGDLSSDPSVQLLLEQGVNIVDKGHPIELLNEKFDYIVKNPGIPYSLDLIQGALKKEIPIFTDVELASWISQGLIIGITGSNGKTTTTQLIYQILKNHDKHQTFLAGNIGVPSLSVIPQANHLDNIVMELSSFQLMGTEFFKPHIAVITNIYEAHLDYHETRENYIDAKLKITQNQTDKDYLVYRYDQGELHQLVHHSQAQKIPFSYSNVDDYVRENGAYVENKTIYYKEAKVIEVSDIHLPGDHNIENVLASIAVAKIMGINNELIKDTVRKYQGMPHRIQFVIEDKGVKYYNDSKATNVTATITALKSFSNPVIYIGGGLDRGNEYSDLLPYLNHVKSAYLFGETKDKMAGTFKIIKDLEVETFNNLPEACRKAYDSAESGDIVLFSPACASWDQYQNFEIRGNHFEEIISTLIEEETI